MRWGSYWRKSAGGIEYEAAEVGGGRGGGASRLVALGGGERGKRCIWGVWFRGRDDGMMEALRVSANNK